MQQEFGEAWKFFLLNENTCKISFKNKVEFEIMRIIINIEYLHAGIITNMKRVEAFFQYILKKKLA